MKSDRLPLETRSAPAPEQRMWVAWYSRGVLGALLIFLSGCGGKLPEGAIVFTQAPVKSDADPAARNILDRRYPSGSRVVLAYPPYRPEAVRVLSAGLTAAGDPVVAPSGREVLFVGKEEDFSPWQIYLAYPASGERRQLTALSGGSMSPTFLSRGRLAFVSPVPPLVGSGASENSALYIQLGSDVPQRLTFGARPVLDCTTLSDGRILFVSPLNARDSGEATATGLFTINDDGTELTQFALDHDGLGTVRRPRQLGDKRVAFLARASESETDPERAEFVGMARPFQSRAQLSLTGSAPCSSVEPFGATGFLACLAHDAVGRSLSTTTAIYRFDETTGAATAGGISLLFHDEHWASFEACSCQARPEPMGHMSAVDTSKRTGTILCLDAQFTRAPEGCLDDKRATRVRVLTLRDQHQVLGLGEVALQTDGSFMATVPADQPIGFETLDSQGKVLQRMAPNLWLRPGENRSCLGCHEPHNRSPRNIRPRAASVPPADLGADAALVNEGPSR